MIRIGVAGWDYADWSGIVYPATADRRFDRLAHISRFVDVVEINSTFYRPATPRVAESWVRRTAGRDGFTFTAKAHRSWTHEIDEDLDRGVAQTLDGLRPLRDAGKLRALLIQFPQAFHYTEHARAHVERLVESVGDWPVAVEVRHATWEDEAAASWAAALGVAWCTADLPQAGRSTLKLLARVTSDLAYLRLHGRNAANWFRPDAGRDARYDYRYSAEELEQLADTAREMARGAEELIVIQNNHFRGQALVNALQLKNRLQEDPPRAPQELVEAYPDLSADVDVQRTRLF
jgi:uncharacterized protein YecE (DUF72 family)